MEYQNIVSDHQRAERFGRLMMTTERHNNNSRPRSSNKEELSDEGFDDIDLDKMSEEEEEEVIDDQIEEEYYQEDEDEIQGQHEDESERMKTCVVEETAYEEVELM
jgi:hypothetical protein